MSIPLKQENTCSDCKHLVGCECFSGRVCDQFEKTVEGADIVSRPKYYNDSKITPFDVIDDWKLDFYLGNAVKYIKRAGKKDGNSRLQDLTKIRTYIDEAIKREEASG